MSELSQLMTAAVLPLRSPIVLTGWAARLQSLPKAPTDTLQDLLAPYGLRLTLTNGKLSILEGVGSALPMKRATLVFVTKMKPDGSVGRGAPEGYNLQAEMGLSNEHYKVLQDVGKLILQRTHSIDTSLSITKQAPGSIDLCIKKLLKVHPEVHAYKPVGYWALRAAFRLLLRNKSGQANTLARELNKISRQVRSNVGPSKPAVKPRRQRGRPRKNPVPSPEGTVTTTSESTIPIQLPLEPGPIAMALCDNGSEFLDLNIGDSDDMDISIRQAIANLSGISLNAESLDDVLTAPISAAAPKTVASPTAPARPAAPPVSASSIPAASATPSAPPVSAQPAYVPPMSVLSAPTVPTALPAQPVPAPAASVSPVSIAPAMPPVDTIPLANAPGSGLASDSVIWRGLTISSANMAKFKRVTASRAAGAKPRCAKIYNDLIVKLIEDPNYNPSSEPNPVSQAAAKKAPPKSKSKSKAKVAPTSSPDVEPNPNADNECAENDRDVQIHGKIDVDSGRAPGNGRKPAGKGKGKAIVEASTNAPSRGSGREVKQTKQ